MFRRVRVIWRTLMSSRIKSMLWVTHQNGADDDEELRRTPKRRASCAHFMLRSETARLANTQARDCYHRSKGFSTMVLYYAIFDT